MFLREHPSVDQKTNLHTALSFTISSDLLLLLLLSSPVLLVKTKGHKQGN
jgi:hypothetical protein